ncbi:MAG: 50S ribosomal protein L21 [Candidatus Melainabacteria bacterium]
MFAIVDLNGRQYEIEEGRYLMVDRLPNEVNDTLDVAKVLLVADGADTLVGAPYVEGATVRATVLAHGRDNKVLVYKMRRKKGYRLKRGHRQSFTKLMINVIEFPGKKATASKAASADETAEKPAKKAAAKSAEKKPVAKKAAKKADTPAEEA